MSGGGSGDQLDCHTSLGPATGQRTLSLVALLGDSQSNVDEDMAADFTGPTVGQRAADEREKRTSVGTELKTSATGGQLFEMRRVAAAPSL